MNGHAMLIKDQHHIYFNIFFTGEPELTHADDSCESFGSYVYVVLLTQYIGTSVSLSLQYRTGVAYC